MYLKVKHTRQLAKSSYRETRAWEDDPPQLEEEQSTLVTSRTWVGGGMKSSSPFSSVGEVGAASDACPFLPPFCFSPFRAFLPLLVKSRWRSHNTSL